MSERTASSAGADPASFHALALQAAHASGAAGLVYYNAQVGKWAKRVHVIGAVETRVKAAAAAVRFELWTRQSDHVPLRASAEALDADGEAAGFTMRLQYAARGAAWLLQRAEYSTLGAGYSRQRFGLDISRATNSLPGAILAQWQVLGASAAA